MTVSDLPIKNTEAAIIGLSMMQRIRFLEEKITELRKQQIIQGSVHLCIGQESIYAGALQALRQGDQVFSTYRGHGWAMACGVPPEAILAELLGRQTGVNQGRGGSAYFSAADWGFYGENSIVGAGAPIACGAALTNKLTRNGAVALTAFGDGAMNQGAIHEAMNFAAYLDLPVIFVCENNVYSELTPIAEMTRDTNLFKRAQAYGIPGMRIDGNDLEAVRDCVAEQAKAAREGKGPVLIEMMTQRLVGHYYGDMQSYRPRGELAEAKKNEPILRLREKLLGMDVSATQLDDCEADARNTIEAAAQKALDAPLADTKTILEHLYA
ncbi:thiamine pyrophosphate-dependent dehydrogenase E1 component subunit alpha [Allopusillimonas ginsengisoli]|uniref:thiamine pyrophosphate-dependent dehydrogenase E1 component subunit alpha n=1 Tax=Allopusillimonas ginsengisoli TaxID=453575 RepID=UPI0010227B01|nr:thiamine pyrophosphate-dependent dehydrogenase E1 component subunit alpha [Allopusillimonas ginsengisoli]TEA79981.1 thiamine pyrophosphate-dependent dehydrogenase E1 component subunit alpha [Allopusillimonas ginsengisoli]